MTRDSKVGGGLYFIQFRDVMLKSFLLKKFCTEGNPELTTQSKLMRLSNKTMFSSLIHPCPNVLCNETLCVTLCLGRFSALVLNSNVYILRNFDSTIPRFPSISKNVLHWVFKGKVRSNMTMIISTDLEAMNFILQLFFPFEVLFFYYHLLKYQIHWFMCSAISC